MIDAGAMNQRIEILELLEVNKTYSWEVQRSGWAKAVLTNKRNNFSVHGIGAAGVTFTIRRQALTLGNAIRYAGHHCFITGILPLDRNHLVVEAALVHIVQCEDKYTGTTFPAVMTEKYLRHDQLEPMAINTLRHVLITPKAIKLQPGELVDVEGVAWPIQVAHVLDPWKNEYEIQKILDL